MYTCTGIPYTWSLLWSETSSKVTRIISDVEESRTSTKYRGPMETPIVLLGVIEICK